MKALLALAGTALLLAACTPSSPRSQPEPSSSDVAWSPPPMSPPPFTASPCAYPSGAVPMEVMVRDVFHTGTGVTETCVDRGPANVYYEFLPDPCSRQLGIRTSSIVARRAVEVLYDDNAGAGDPSTSMYRHTVTVYNSGDAASAYMSSVRAAVRECPIRKVRNATWRYTIVSSSTERMELSVKRSADEAAEGVPSQATFRVSIARSGTHVSVLTDVGWEGYPSAKPAVDALVKAAADELDRWD